MVLDCCSGKSAKAWGGRVHGHQLGRGEDRAGRLVLAGHPLLPGVRPDPRVRDTRGTRACGAPSQGMQPSRPRLRARPCSGRPEAHRGRCLRPDRRTRSSVIFRHAGAKWIGPCPYAPCNDMRRGQVVSGVDFSKLEHCDRSEQVSQAAEIAGNRHSAPPIGPAAARPPPGALRLVRLRERAMDRLTRY